MGACWCDRPRSRLKELDPEQPGEQGLRISQCGNKRDLRFQFDRRSLTCRRRRRRYVLDSFPSFFQDGDDLSSFVFPPLLRRGRVERETEESESNGCFGDEDIVVSRGSGGGA